MKSSTLSMKVQNWNIKYSINMPTRPTQDGESWYFTIPKDTGEVDYVLCDHNQPITAEFIKMEGLIEADSKVEFDYKTEGNNQGEGNPPQFRVLLYRNMNGTYDRWWSNPLAVNLKPGKFSLSVPLTSDNFSSVNGAMGNSSAAAEAGFKQTLSNPFAIGITFGGGYFFGHGIKVRNGSAKFKMNKFYLYPETEVKVSWWQKILNLFGKNK